MADFIRHFFLVFNFAARREILLGHFLTIELPCSVLLVAISVTSYIVINTTTANNYTTTANNTSPGIASIIINSASTFKLNSYFD